MAFGIPGLTAPAQTAATNRIGELEPRNPKLGDTKSPVGAPPDLFTRGDATTDSNAYHVAIAKFSAGSSTARGAAPAHSVADMSLLEKVSTTARAGMGIAAKDVGGAVKTALSDPKTQAMVVGGTAIVAGAQFVPGLDVAVDGTLGVAGVATYLSVAPQHRDNMVEAVSKLKTYTSEVGGAKTQADLDKASHDFADFVKLGGEESLDALGTIAGGAAATVKVAGGVTKLGRLDGVRAAATNASDAVTAAGHAAVAAGDTVAQHLVSGIGGSRELAAAGPTVTEMRALPDAIRPSGSAGVRNKNGAGPARAASDLTAARDGEVLEGTNPNTLTGLHPNAAYEFKGGFTYHTDEQGRVRQVEATLGPDVQGGDRSKTLQKTAGGIDRLTTDEGGHLIATRFNGPAHEANHVAQDIKLNRGQFKTLENRWAKELDAGRTINVKIDLTYPAGSQRPSSLLVSTTADGIKQQPRLFVNEAPGS